jgi:hypothetical protein
MRGAGRWGWLLAGLVVGIACSRGPKLVPVSGVVLLDGQPVANAAVLFIPAEGRPAEGTTDAEGKFTLQTFQPGDGALVGLHDVTVTGVRVHGVTATTDGLSDADPGKVRYEWFVPQRYSVRETSQLKVEVKPGMGPVKLELASK